MIIDCWPQFLIYSCKNITNPEGHTYGNGNILGATNLAHFLKDKVLGKPIVYNGTKVSVNSLISGKTGILYFQNFIEDNGRSNANTHIELWNKDHYMSSYPFSQMFDATNIWFWEVK